jgi:hypothetical protein
MSFMDTKAPFWNQIQKRSRLPYFCGGCHKGKRSSVQYQLTIFEYSNFGSRPIERERASSLQQTYFPMLSLKSDKVRTESLDCTSDRWYK